MSTDTKGVTVHLLGGEYRIACQASEREGLLEAARYLDERMLEIRDRSSKLLNLEALAIMVALNLSYELLEQQRQAVESDALVNRHVRDLLQKIDVVLSKAA